MAKMEFNYISQFAITTAHEGEWKKGNDKSIEKSSRPGSKIYATRE
jgi:hypothetical protein